MKQDSFHSDLRACSTIEPKFELSESCIHDVQQVNENRKRSFNDWVTGLQMMKGFGPGLSETDAFSFGKWAAVPEGHFVPEIRLKNGQKDSRKVVL